jgi:hypothetical protein
MVVGVLIFFLGLKTGEKKYLEYRKEPKNKTKGSFFMQKKTSMFKNLSDILEARDMKQWEKARQNEEKNDNTNYFFK